MSDLKEQTQEYILCSAVWFDDGKKYEHQPKNIETGYVVCGRRHHNCFALLSYLADGGYIKDEKEQGFLTNTDRFVDRKEAVQIALASGQIQEPKHYLFSEDLW